MRLPEYFMDKQAQFLETRRFQIEEVARWFNIPVHKLKEQANGQS